MIDQKLRDFLEHKTNEYNRSSFISEDPVSVPHLFRKKQDIEIAGFFSAIFSWGNRKTIIQKSTELMGLMKNAPHAFCLDNDASDLRRLLSFRHRTFTATDLLYFISFLQFHYRREISLESAFTKHGRSIKEMLTGFQQYFFSLPDAPSRTKKHIANPTHGSSCKRLNMFLRWMVRHDDKGVDFGIWENISPSQLICPIDLHVARVAKKLGLLQRKPIDWLAAEELTEQLRAMDRDDPVKYDFALFGLGVNEKF